jgi:hypothetical protein
MEVEEMGGEAIFTFYGSENQRQIHWKKMMIRRKR